MVATGWDLDSASGGYILGPGFSLWWLQLGTVIQLVVATV